MKFEEAVKKLELLVEELEEGELSLEGSLKAFEEGIYLSKNCMKILEKVEKRVDVLVKEPDGSESLESFSSLGSSLNLEVDEYKGNAKQ